MKIEKKSMTYFIAALLIIQFGSSQQSYAQRERDDSVAMTKADTSRFFANTKADWKLFNSYVTQYTPDSVSLEVIIQQSKVINWKTEQSFGKIKDKKLLPLKEQNIVYYLLNDSYAIRIETEGKCYIKFLDGVPPSAAPTILPIKINYKND